LDIPAPTLLKIPHQSGAEAIWMEQKTQALRKTYRNLTQKLHLVLVAISTERSFMQLAGHHFNGVSYRAALPGALALSSLSGKFEIKRSTDLRFAKQRQPLEPSGSKAPLAFLDYCFDSQDLAVKIGKSECSRRARILGCSIDFVPIVRLADLGC
jgi:hypothetical protein